MGVEIAHNGCITINTIQKSLKVGTVSWSARQIWREIYVEDCDVDVTEMDVDGLKFEVRISSHDSVNVNRRILHVMADEDGEAPAAAPRTIPS